jgi:hypothetical protein
MSASMLVCIAFEPVDYLWHCILVLDLMVVVVAVQELLQFEGVTHCQSLGMAACSRLLSRLLSSSLLHCITYSFIYTFLHVSLGNVVP